MMERIKVTVQRAKPGQVWVYRKPDNKWTILECLSDSMPKLAALGVLEQEPRHGDILELEGQWKKSTFNGRDEFHFRSATLYLPTDSRSLLHYAVMQTKGLGAVREVEIWERYGDKWREQETLDIKGLPAEVEFHWKDTLRRLTEQAQQTNTIAWLLAKGCTLNLATVAWKTWEAKTAQIVGADPYRLADLPRYGFQDIDNGIRQRFGITDNDGRRIAAAVLYSMGKACDGGDTAADWMLVFNLTRELVPGTANNFDGAVQELVRQGKLTVLPGARLAKHDDVRAEEAIWSRFNNKEVA